MNIKRDRFTERQMDIQKDRKIYREANGYTLHRETDRYTERQMDIQRD
jgi:hypothetical protein